MFSYCIYRLVMAMMRRLHLLNYQAFLLPQSVVKGGMRFSQQVSICQMPLDGLYVMMSDPIIVRLTKIQDVLLLVLLHVLFDCSCSCGGLGLVVLIVLLHLSVLH